jgi:carboxyl-terminal processing protease
MSFSANVDDEFAAAAKELQQAGAERLVIDLRDNPGGLLDSAVDLAGWLLPSESLVVQERYSNGLVDQSRANGNAQLAKLPTVVLMNGGSASAAEILAGALHDIRNIPLVGEQSFGKGSVQQLENFYNGSSLKVTVAKWLTPNGVNISAKGITPTVEVKLDPKDPNAKNWIFGTPGKDPQLDKAIELILK